MQGERLRRYLFALAIAGGAFALLLAPGAALSVRNAALSIPSGPFTGDVSTSSSTHTNVLSVAGASDCNGAAAPTVTSDAAQRKYLSYAFVNDTGTDICVTVNYTVISGSAFFAAYLGSFNPASIGANFVGSGPHGADCGGAQQGTFGFQVPAGQTFVIVVEDCTPGSGGQFSFTLGSEPISVTIGDVTKTPNPASMPVPGGPVTFTVVVPNLSPYVDVSLTLQDNVYGDLLDAGNNQVSQNTCLGHTSIPRNTTLTCSFVATITGIPGSQHTDIVTATIAGGGAQASDTGTATVTITTPSAATFRSASASKTAHGVILRWRTGTEVDLLGFHLYRSRGHSWVRLTRSLIAAKGAVSGASYRFVDKTARRGARYRIKAVDRDGTASWFGPVRAS